MVRFRTNGRPLDGAGCAAIYLCVRNDLDLYLGPFASGGRCDCQSPSLIHDHISAGPPSPPPPFHADEIQLVI